MFFTDTYRDHNVVPPCIAERWLFAETCSAAAILKAVCPQEWSDILHVLEHFSLNPSTWLKPGGNRGKVPEELDGMFRQRGWRVGRLDLVTYGLLRAGSEKGKQKNQVPGRIIRRLPRVVQEGYEVDNIKGSVALDIEWNAKDGNLDRDFGAYRAWHGAGALTAAVIITQHRQSLKVLAERLWNEYQANVEPAKRTKRLPIDLNTSTTTNFDKALLRLRRGAAGACPVLVIGACDKTWNGQPYTP